MNWNSVASVLKLTSLVVVAQRLSWWYVGALCFMLGLGVWPWFIFQFWNNENYISLNWNLLPEEHNHFQILMYKAALLGRRSFENSMWCFAK